ncbi:hypothetical protein RPB_0602 [Rhodopseudomonas palustris HaA2]|uniref:Uncharacterized protein n=1 Tax=Rhodopseudomonas palustris (strain HaA2) TaxID=316058 RepID=Q2J2J7_RHOP2|nr:hypothetical protein [Rhodopseudomonas palustris]ABD05313.1 hypothetical protein RPB_0602 [Rhodopseudomonas palustris HaA2]
MKTKIDEAALFAMNVHQRHQLWINARKIDSEEAREVVRLIEDLGLPYSEDRSLKLDDPINQKMYQIINSKEGKAAAFEATANGRPALEGIDPLLLAALGVDYGKHNDTTINAGYLVAQMMRSQGYQLSGRKGKLPSSCVAKTAEIYVPNSKASSLKHG